MRLREATLEEKIAEMQVKVDAIYKMLLADKSLGDWIIEARAIELSGLSKSTLFVLRKAGKLTSSTISGKGVFYRRSDFERMLNDNEKNM
jgi:hypothetical protein